jgi:hypothetical protein
MKRMVRIALLTVLGVAVGFAGDTRAQMAPDTGSIVRMQQLHGAMQERMAPQDCELQYRGFRARNTLTLSQRRAVRERCRELARQRQSPEIAVRTPGPAPAAE